MDSTLEETGVGPNTLVCLPSGLRDETKDHAAIEGLLDAGKNAQASADNFSQMTDATSRSNEQTDGRLHGMITSISGLEVTLKRRMGFACEADKARIGTMLEDMSQKLQALLKSRDDLRVALDTQDEIYEKVELERRVELGDMLAETLKLELRLENLLGGHARIDPEEVKILLESMAPKVEMLVWLSQHEKPIMPEYIPSIRQNIPPNSTTLDLASRELHVQKKFDEFMNNLPKSTNSLTDLDIR